MNNIDNNLNQIIALQLLSFTQIESINVNLTSLSNRLNDIIQKIDLYLPQYQQQHHQHYHQQQQHHHQYVDNNVDLDRLCKINDEQQQPQQQQHNHSNKLSCWKNKNLIDYQHSKYKKQYQSIPLSPPFDQITKTYWFCLDDFKYLWACLSLNQLKNKLESIFSFFKYYGTNNKDKHYNIEITIPNFCLINIPCIKPFNDKENTLIINFLKRSKYNITQSSTTVDNLKKSIERLLKKYFEDYDWILTQRIDDINFINSVCKETINVWVSKINLKKFAEYLRCLTIVDVSSYNDIYNTQCTIPITNVWYILKTLIIQNNDNDLFCLKIPIHEYKNIIYLKPRHDIWNNWVPNNIKLIEKYQYRLYDDDDDTSLINFVTEQLYKLFFNKYDKI